MAASRMISRGTPAHKNPPSSQHHHHHHHHHHPNAPDDAVFEFDESDLLWSSNDDASSDPRRPQPRSLKKLQRRPSAAEAPSPAAASLPMNIPDWSKILQGDCGEHHRGREGAEDGGSDGDEGDDDGDRVPPHEFLARRRGASLSVHEGVGRTLKGRDLRRVRNAIWKEVGFED